MAVTVYARSRHINDITSVVNTLNPRHEPAEVRMECGDWDKSLLSIRIPRASFERVEHARPDSLKIEVGGVTLTAVIDAIVKCPDCFKYLTSAVDHLRENPGEYSRSGVTQDGRHY